MTAPIVIKSSDTNVPVLSGTEGRLAALIRYIAPILGWEIMFDTGPVIVVRPQRYKEGQALLYRFDDKGIRGGAAPRVAEVRAYESMAGINSGAGLVGPVYVHKSYYSNTTAQAYLVVGDAYGFIIRTCAVHFNDNNLYSFQYFGFLNPFRNDLPICCAAGQLDGDASDLLVAKNPSSGGGTGCFLHRSYSEALNTSASLINSGGGQLDDIAFGSMLSTQQPYPYRDGLLYSQAFINDGSGYSQRAYIPGLYAAHHNPSAPPPETISVDGHNFIHCWGCSSASGESGMSYGLLLDIGEGFRP